MNILVADSFNTFSEVPMKDHLLQFLCYDRASKVDSIGIFFSSVRPLSDEKRKFFSKNHEYANSTSKIVFHVVDDVWF